MVPPTRSRRVRASVRSFISGKRFRGRIGAWGPVSNEGQVLRALAGKFVCAFVIAVGVSGAGVADEGLVMPFACQVERGKVVLSPSPNQTYRIYGKREQRKVTTCSQFGNGCRRSTVYRFDLDCGGTRTDWRSVVTAMAPWTKPEPGYGDFVPIREYRGPYLRYYFAPPYGPPMALGPYGPPRAYRIPPAPRQAGLPAGFAPIPERLAYFTAIPDLAPPGSLSEAQTVPLPSRKPVLPAELANNAPKPSLASPSASPAVEVAGQAKSDQRTPPDQAADEITGTLPKSSKAATNAAWVNLLGAVGLSVAAFIFFASAFVLSRRRPRTLQLAETLPPERIPFAAGRPGPLDPAFRGSRERTEPQPPAPSQSEWLPATLSEALEVLGASPETGLDVLKAIVKSLRRTWHPDFASHEDDRRVRERKLKQVNVAWDIVSGKRRAGKSSVAA